MPDLNLRLSEAAPVAFRISDHISSAWRRSVRRRLWGASIAALAVVALAADTATAEVLYWDPNGPLAGRGGSSPPNWISDATNNPSNRFWDPNPGGVCVGPCRAWNNSNLDDARFGGTFTGTVILGTPIVVHDMFFENGAETNYTINSSVSTNTLTLGGLNPTITVDGNTNDSVTINSFIAGSAGLTKAGGGILNLNGANTFTGTVDVNAGRLIVNGDAALGHVDNVVDLADGVGFGSTGSLSDRVVNLSGTGAAGATHATLLRTAPAATNVGSAHFTGSGGLIVNGGVSLTDGTNDYDGETRFVALALMGNVFDVSVLANQGQASSVGTGDTVSRIVIQAHGNSGEAILRYTGAATSTDRDWQINSGGFGEAELRNSGGGLLTLTGGITLGGGAGDPVTLRADTHDIQVGDPVSGGGVISSSGNAPLVLQGSSTGRTVALYGDNTYTGATSIGTVTVKIDSLADAGFNSSFGTASSVVPGPTTFSIGITNGAVSYVGDGDSSDRTWGINAAGNIRNDGTGALNLSGSMTFVAGGSVENLTLGGSFGDVGDPNDVNTLSGVVSGSGNLIMNGAAGNVWEIGGANTYTGSVTVNGGTLRAAAGNTQAFGAPNALTVNTGGTLDLNDNDFTFTSLAGTGGTVALGTGNLTINGTTSTTYAGSITGDGSIAGNGGLIKRGTSTLTLTGDSDYTGDTTIQGGTLALNFAAAGAPTDHIIDVNSTLVMTGGTLTATGANGVANTQNFDGLNINAGSNRITATAGVGPGSGMTINLGAINRTGGLIDFGIGTGGTIATIPGTTLGGWATVNGSDYAEVDGSGNIVAFTAYDLEDNPATWGDGDVVSDAGGAPNTPFSGGPVSDAGGDNRVQLGGLKYTAAASSTVTVGAGQTLGVDGTIIVSSSVGAANQTITGGSITGSEGGGILGVLQNGTGNFHIASRIVDNGGAIGFTKGGTGQVSLSNTTNNYTGVTTLSGGTLVVSSIGNGGAESAIGASSADSSNLVLEGGTLHYNGGTATTDRGFTLVNGGASRAIRVDAGVNLTFNGLVTSPDDAGFTKTGSGTLTLSNGGNNYIGVTRIEGGILSVDNLADAGQVSGIGASTNVSGGLVLTNGGTLQYTGTTDSIDRGFTLESGNGGIEVTSDLTELELSGAAVGAGRLVKSGAGTLILSGTNTYTGGTTVSAGTLRAGSTQAFGGAANGAGAGQMNVMTGATLELADNNNIVGGLIGGGTVELGTATLTINNNGNAFTGAIHGTGGITLTGGTQVMTTCDNDYTGVTRVQNATLSTNCLKNAGVDSGIGASTDVSGGLVLANGTLLYTGIDETINRGLTVENGTDGAVNVSNAGTTLTLTGALAGNGRLIKNGQGTLVLAGTTAHTGETRIDDGILRLGAANAMSTNGLRMGSTSIGGGNFRLGTLDLNGFNATVAWIDDHDNNNSTPAGNILLSGGATLTINAGHGDASVFYDGVIGGNGNLVKTGNNIQRITGCNSSYSGTTTINGTNANAVLEVSCLANGGSNSSIGASLADASNLVLNGGTLRYVGDGDSTNRLFTLGATGGALDASGTGAIHFTNDDPIVLTGTGARTLTLTGTSGAAIENRFALLIADAAPVTGRTALTKTGSNVWILENEASTYTGVTTISGGVLGVDKLSNGGVASSIGMSSNAASNLIIGSGAVLRYTGDGDTTDRLFTLQTGTANIESSGTGPIEFRNTGDAVYQGTGDRILALGGTNTGVNIMGVRITNHPTSGITSLAKNGPGTWILTGNNTFTGNTTINDGNLVIGDPSVNGGTTGNAGFGNVIVNSPTSVLSFNRTDTFDFNGLLSGPGSIAQIGTGTTRITNTSAVGHTIGGTRLEAGALQINSGVTLNTATIDTNQTGATTPTLMVNGTVQGTSGGAPASFTGGNGASNISIALGGILRANGTLGGGTDIVTVTGMLDTGAAQLNLGEGDDTLALNDTAVFSGAGVNAGTGGETAGIGDLLQVNTVAGRTLDGANVASFERLLKQGTGILTLTGAHSYSAGATVDAGDLRIGNGGTSGALDSNVLLNGAATTLSFYRSDEYSFGGIISGTGGVNQIGGGTTILTGNNNYTGATNVQSGALFVNGNQSGATGPTSVAAGATLGGGGTIGGSVTVAGGGIINPGDPGNDPGTLNILGGLTLADTSILNFNFGLADAPGNPINDVINVGGNLRLDGILNVSTTQGGSFGPGLYRVINYTGALDNQGLQLGTMPEGSDAFLQTTVANQINLINEAGLTLTFWDGPDNQNDDVIQGGDGFWQNASGNDNWTDSEGSVNAPWTNAEFAIFMGSDGRVTVDNSLGAVRASGMQFAVGGYIIDGQPLTLIGPNSIIRVGDGSSAGADMTATIEAVLQGDTTLVKDDLGTLILTGINTYNGGTDIDGGVLQISADNNLGFGAITFDGGTLRNTGAFDTARIITLEDEGGTFDTVADLELTGAIGGSGSLTKTGDATLTLTGLNLYEGGTVIDEGVVSVSQDANLGHEDGTVTFDGGTLQNTGAFATNRATTINAGGGTFLTDDVLTWMGGIGGAGALTKDGASTLILTNDANNYGGGTTIAEGTLQLGDGNSTGAITGNVTTAADTTLAFNRNNTLPFDGLISGTGAVRQIGSGTTILTADNTYDGPTTVANGTLIINGDQTNADGPTTVEDGGTLGGTGTVGGDVTIELGGRLSPGEPGPAPGALDIDGNLTLLDGAILEYSFGQADVEGGPFNDLTRVDGNLVLDGVINVNLAPGGAFGPGIYRVISYTGSITDDNTLDIGTLPPESDPNQFSVQTSIDHQVNLVSKAGQQLQFWDLTPKDNDRVNGNGDLATGIWQTGGTLRNWTDETGDQNAEWDNGNFAIFAGQSGIVTVDNDSFDPVEASGMQFAVDGYTINGQTLTLVGDPNSIIVVGDGTEDGADYTATIAAQLAGATQLVKTDLGTLVLTGDNIYSGGTRFEGGTVQVSTNANLGDTEGDLTFAGGTLHTTASFATGIGRSVILESTGTIFTDPSTTLTLDGTISGPGGWTKDGGGTVLQNGLASNDGPTTVAEGTLRAGGVDRFSTFSEYIVEEGGTLDLAGFNQTIAALANGGDLHTNGAGPGTILTVLTDYVGANGTLHINTRLGDDSSPTDRLVVQGDTSGATSLDVTNVGGTGAPTVVGIKVVDVGDASNGLFILEGDYLIGGQQVIAAGAFGYILQKDDATGPGDDGDWYLRSITSDGGGPLFQPGVPIYETYPEVLQAFMEMDTLQQRVGNRSWATTTTGERNGLWARIEAAHAEIEPDVSTSGANYDYSIWNIQAGADLLIAEQAGGTLFAGITGHYGTVSSGIDAIHGNGSIDATGYGLSATLTWYGDNGFYADGQAQVTWFDSDLRSSTAGESLVDGNDGMGYGVSAEVGQRIALGGPWSVTPQAQLAYTSVDFDDFSGPFDADVSLDKSDSLIGRLGVSLDRQVQWLDAEGRTNRSHLYGLANLYYDFADGSEVDVADVPFSSETEALWGGIGLGGTLDFADGRFAIHGEVLAKTGLENFGDNPIISGTVGAEVRW